MSDNLHCLIVGLMVGRSNNLLDVPNKHVLATVCVACILTTLILRHRRQDRPARRTLRGLLAQKYSLMIDDFDGKMMPWTTKSKWVGYSAACYVLPAVLPIYPHSLTLFDTVFRGAWCVQAGVSYWSDYMHTGHRHVSHGVDRWLATSMLVVTVVLTAMNLGPEIALVAVTPPLVFQLKGQAAVRDRRWDAYVLNHTLWHVVGGFAAAYVLHNVQLAKTTDDSRQFMQTSHLTPAGWGT